MLFVVLSPQGSFSLFSSLVRCVFLLLPLFFFPCFEFRVVWGSASFVVLFVLSFHRLILRASSGSSRFVGLRIEGRPAEESQSGRTSGGLGSPTAMVVGVLPVGYLLPPGKGKGKISENRYPCGSEYLRVAVRYADAVGPSQVEPSYAKTFATCYGSPPGVRIWCHDFLTSYVVPVPKMVCFFEAAFENGLRFSLHPFIKSVLQHFNVCSSQLSPNFWGVLVGLLVVFRDKGLGVSSIALLLDLFSVKEASEGFLYISKRATAIPIISDLPSSYKHWKELYFFVGVDIRNTTVRIKTIRWGFRQYGLPLRTYVKFLSMLVGVDFL